MRVGLKWIKTVAPKDSRWKRMPQVWEDAGGWKYYYDPVEDVFWKSHCPAGLVYPAGTWWKSAEGFGR